MAGRVRRNAAFSVALVLALVLPLSRQPATAQAATRVQAARWTVSLSADLNKVDPGTKVTIWATPNRPIGNGRHFIHIVDVTAGAVVLVCDTLPCTTTVTSADPREARYQALLLDRKSRVVASSHYVPVEWLKSDVWNIQFHLSIPSATALPLGYSPQLVATVDRELTNGHYLQVSGELIDSDGFRVGLEHEESPCSNTTQCTVTWPSPAKEGTWRLFAEVWGPSRVPGVKSQIITGTVLIVTWRQLTVTLLAPAAGTVGVAAELKAGWNLELTNTQFYWNVTADGTEVKGGDDCGVQASENPGARSCTIKVTSQNAGAVKYQVTVGTRDTNTEIGKSTEETVNWQRNLAVTLGVQPNTTILRGTDASTVVGTNVDLTATGNSLPPGYYIAIYDGNNTLIKQCDAGVNPCQTPATSNQPGTVTYHAVETDGGIGTADSNEIKVFYTPDFAVGLEADKQSALLGNDVTLTASFSPAPDGTQFRAAIVSESVSGGEQQTVKDCPGGEKTCIVTVTDDQVDTVIYTVTVQGPNGATMVDADGNQVKASVNVDWHKSTLDWEVTPDRHDFAVGTSVSLTLKANPPADGQTTSLAITGSDGAIVANCKQGATCTGTATANTAGTVIYKGVILDNHGNELDSIEYSINWVQFQVSLSSNAGGDVPVGKTVTLQASASPNLQAEGYELHVSIPGQDIPCDSMTDCTLPAESNSAQQITFSAQVIDTATGKAVSPAVTTQVTWVDFTLTVGVNPGTTVPVGTNVVFTMSASPSDPDFTLSITSSGGTYTCPTMTNCTAHTQSSTPQSATYTIAVQDTATGTTRASRTVTITWQGTSTPSPCPGASCLVLNPSSGGPNSAFNATWYDAADPNGTVTYYLDGAPVGGQSTLQLDGSGTATLKITLNNASAGNHEVDAFDNAGGQGSALYTVTGGGGGGGNGVCGVTVASFTASVPNPVPSGQDVTLTATLSGPLPQGCFLKFADYTSGSIGFIYDQFDAPATQGAIDVPWGPTFGQTGCSAEGTGTCAYAAFVVHGDTNTPDSTPATLTVMWNGSSLLAAARSAPLLQNAPRPAMPVALGQDLLAHRKPLERLSLRRGRRLAVAERRGVSERTAYSRA